ncbi:hypothetical protein HNR63_000223 [Anoxybacillus kamchatkensis]|uniref:hypothetical protein n=1 Tax=Anoxybacillus ayderensis TaxID=265546 RepID=UPI0015EBA3A4|nr:hypothetical protein [Anoxybacillus ayderensis]MBA2877196.1 hypothetical protein [Anoxybacillus ayderensis]
MSKNILEYSLQDFSYLMRHTNILDEIKKAVKLQISVTRFAYFVVAKEIGRPFSEKKLIKYGLIKRGVTAANRGRLQHILTGTFVDTPQKINHVYEETTKFITGIETVGQLLNEIIQKEQDQKLRKKYEQIREFLRTRKSETFIIPNERT